MTPFLKTAIVVALASLASPQALGADMAIELTIPRIDTAEYHRPYVAVWIQDAHKKTIRDIAVWYEQEKARDEGREWLKDLRQWWRLSGRSQEHPANGVSGATRAAGVQTIKVTDQVGALAELPAGEYQLVVEAVREKGSHELVRLPLAWPPTQAATHTAQGDSELGRITLNVAP